MIQIHGRLTNHHSPFCFFLELDLFNFYFVNLFFQLATRPFKPLIFTQKKNIFKSNKTKAIYLHILPIQYGILKIVHLQFFFVTHLLFLFDIQHSPFHFPFPQVLDRELIHEQNQSRTVLLIYNQYVKYKMNTKKYTCQYREYPNLTRYII